MPGNITSADAIVMLAVNDLFNTPIQLQGFSADNIFEGDSINSAELSMGIDGLLSGGFTFKEIPWSIELQADSDSNQLFDTWWPRQQQNRGLYIANGSVQLPAIGKKWNLTRGFLTGYKPMPDAQKTLRPRRYQITWNALVPAPI